MLYRILEERARKQPKKIAIVSETRSLSYSGLLAEVRHAASYLNSHGVKIGDAVILAVPPSPEFYVVFYACAAIGATVIPVLPGGKISPHLRALAPVIAVGDDAFINQAKKTCRSIRAEIVYSPGNGLALPPGSSSFVRKKILRQEPIVVVSSSGTTGAPKLFFRGPEVMIRRARLRIQALKITAEDILMSPRPYNNDSSISDVVVLAVVAGCKVIVHEKFERFKAAAAIANEKVSLLYAVPVIFDMLTSLPPHEVDLSSVRLCVSGGAPLGRAVYDRFLKRFGLPIRQRYGASHIYPAFNYDVAGAPLSVGQTHGSFPMTVVDDAGHVVGPGFFGEIAVDLRRLKDRYWKAEFKDNPLRRGRYLYTGDLGRMSQEGNLYIIGRKSPFIKVGANRVAPAEVETILRSHPLVREVLVCADRLGKVDEAVRAIVVPRGKLTHDAVLKYCSEHLDSYKCPRKIEFRKSLPRNAHGKVLRYLFDARKPLAK